MNNLLAGSENIGVPIKGIGPLGLENGQDAGTIFNKFISSAVGLMTIIAAIWFIFLFMSGAISLITSAGDKNAAAAARGKLASGLIGLIVVISAIFIIKLIGYLLGFDLILNPAGFIDSLWNTP